MLVLAVLFAWPRIASKETSDDLTGSANGSLIADDKINERIEKAGLECIDGHTNLVSHIHPELGINVDGERQVVQANIGISYDCMAEIHTHDTTGKIHAEAFKPGRTFTLQQFFDVWGRPLQRSGYKLEIAVNDKPSNELGGLILRDRDKIVLNYTSLEKSE